MQVRLRSVVEAPVDRDAALLEAHVIDVGGDERNQALFAVGVGLRLRPGQAKHAVGSGIDQPDDGAHGHTLAIDDGQADEVDPVILSGTRLRERASGKEDACTTERFCARAIVDAAHLSHDEVAMLARRGDGNVRRECRGGTGGTLDRPVLRRP